MPRHEVAAWQSANIFGLFSSARGWIIATGAVIIKQRQ